MPDGDDWLLRPVFAGCIKYESLIDGTLDLADVALLNDALDVQQENQDRVNDAQERVGRTGSTPLGGNPLSLLGGDR
jgi:hypothetical protein